MPSTFDSFSNGDVIYADNVSEMHLPIQNLERGKSFYGEASGGPTAYTVTLSPAPDSSYQSGMIVNFKVNVQNTAGSPDVTLNINSVGAKPIVKNGGASLVAGDLKANQIVSLIYDEVEEQFNLLSVSSVNGLDDLSDVAISSPSSGQMLRHNGTNFVNAGISASDLPSSIDAAKIGSGGVSNTEFGYLDGVTSALQTQIDGKAASSHNHAASAINSGQIALARGGTGSDLSATGGSGQVLKQSTSGGNISVGALAAGDMPSGIDATKIGGGAVSNTEFGYLDGVTSALQTQIDGKAASSHNHAASAINSGQIALARGGTGSDLSATGGAGQVLKQASAGAAITVGALSMADLQARVCFLTRTTDKGWGANFVLDALTWDTEVCDPLGLHSTSSNTERINLTTSGYWLVFYSLAFLNNDAASNIWACAELFKNTTSICQVTMHGPANGYREMQMHSPYIVSSNGSDYVQVKVQTDNYTKTYMKGNKSYFGAIFLGT